MAESSPFLSSPQQDYTSCPSSARAVGSPSTNDLDGDKERQGVNFSPLTKTPPTILRVPPAKTTTTTAGGKGSMNFTASTSSFLPTDHGAQSASTLPRMSSLANDQQHPHAFSYPPGIRSPFLPTFREMQKPQPMAAADPSGGGGGSGVPSYSSSLSSQEALTSPLTKALTISPPQLRPQLCAGRLEILEYDEVTTTNSDNTRSVELRRAPQIIWKLCIARLTDTELVYREIPSGRTHRIELETALRTRPLIPSPRKYKHSCLFELNIPIDSEGGSSGTKNVLYALPSSSPITKPLSDYKVPRSHHSGERKNVQVDDSSPEKKTFETPLSSDNAPCAGSWAIANRKSKKRTEKGEEEEVIDVGESTTPNKKKYFAGEEPPDDYPDSSSLLNVPGPKAGSVPTHLSRSRSDGQLGPRESGFVNSYSFPPRDHIEGETEQQQRSREHKPLAPEERKRQKRFASSVTVPPIELEKITRGPPERVRVIAFRAGSFSSFMDWVEGLQKALQW